MPDLVDPDACDRAECACGHRMCFHCLEPQTADSAITRHGNHYHRPGCRNYVEHANEGENDRCAKCPPGSFCPQPGPGGGRMCPCDRGCKKDPALWGV